jgi:hypothetical protein
MEGKVILILAGARLACRALYGDVESVALLSHWIQSITEPAEQPGNHSFDPPHRLPVLTAPHAEHVDHFGNYNPLNLVAGFDVLVGAASWAIWNGQEPSELLGGLGGNMTRDFQAVLTIDKAFRDFIGSFSTASGCLRLAGLCAWHKPQAFAVSFLQDRGPTPSAPDFCQLLRGTRQAERLGFGYHKTR